MARKNPPAKWVLPDVVHPPDSICFKIPVPNNPYYLAAFRGALLNLASAAKWGDDTAHTALEVAAVWQTIYDQVVATPCKSPVPAGSLVETDFISKLIQVICDAQGNCILQYRCDVCSDWITAGTLAQINQPTNTGPGNKTPDPGHCMSYHGTLTGNSAYLLPAVVNTGDVITFSNFNGSTSATNGLFYCANGQELFLTCFGTPPAGSGSDIDSSFPHYGLIVTIGTHHYLATAGPITVPSGVSNSQVTLRINAVSTDILGAGFTFDVEDCNNGTPTWTHHFNFALNDGGWILDPAVGACPGQYIPGQGWTSLDGNCVGASAGYLTFLKHFAATITNIRVIYSVAGAGWTGDLDDGSIALGILDTTAGSHDLSFPGTHSITDHVRFALTTTTTGGTIICTDIYISGTGTDPF